VKIAVRVETKPVAASTNSKVLIALENPGAAKDSSKRTIETRKYQLYQYLAGISPR
jgi:hypothetical protein